MGYNFFFKYCCLHNIALHISMNNARIPQCWYITPNVPKLKQPPKFHELLNPLEMVCKCSERYMHIN